MSILTHITINLILLTLSWFRHSLWTDFYVAFLFLTLLSGEIILLKFFILVLNSYIRVEEFIEFSDEGASFAGVSFLEKNC